MAIQTGSTYLRQYDRYHYNSDAKPELFGQRELAESVLFCRFLHRTTTGNSDTATKTGNSYTSMLDYTAPLCAATARVELVQTLQTSQVKTLDLIPKRSKNIYES